MDTKKQQRHHRRPRPRRRPRHHFSDVTGNQAKSATAMSEAKPVRDGDAQWAQMMAFHPRKTQHPCPSDNKKGVVANVAAKSAAPENRAGKEKSSAKRRGEGRARLCGGAQVGSGGVGGGVAALFGWELTETAADWGGEGRRGVDGVSGGDAAGIVSGAKGEGRIEHWRDMRWWGVVHLLDRVDRPLVEVNYGKRHA